MKKHLILTGLAFMLYTTVFCQNSNTEKAKTEAWNTVRTINRHWAFTENMDSLGLYLHPEMVLILPSSKERMKGKSVIIESYRKFTKIAKTISLKELDPLIQLYNNNTTAIVTFYYILEIKIADGEVQKFTGRDMYTLVKENNMWIAVAQHYSSVLKQ